MSLSLIFLVPVIPGPGGLARALRWTFAGAFMGALISLVVVIILHGVVREYRFEILVICINWLALIAGGILAALLFRSALKSG
jgi:hypothetical protein